MKFSANLGFLWHDRPLPEAIVAAKAAGFHGVECHFPYETDPAEVKAALDATGLPMVGINTVHGDVVAGEFGLAALPGREADARRAIDQAVGYAAEIGARNVHVLAGNSSGSGAMGTFVANLAYAAESASEWGINILIEPLNPRSNPGYFLNSSTLAKAILQELDLPNVKLMFDCFHIQIIEGDLLNRATELMPLIGHIQFAGVPQRHEPDTGEVCYDWLLPKLVEAGYEGYFGAEYRPSVAVEAGLGWMSAYH